MTFPSWCESDDSQERARLRLRFLINRLASEATADGTIQALAALCDVDKSTFYKSMQDGAFSVGSALRISGACPGMVDHKDLCFPLEIV